MLIKDKTVLAAAKIVLKFATEVALKHNKDASEVLLTAVWYCLNNEGKETLPAVVASRRRGPGRRKAFKAAIKSVPVEDVDEEDDQDVDGDDRNSSGFLDDQIQQQTNSDAAFNDHDCSPKKSVTKSKRLSREIHTLTRVKVKRSEDGDHKDSEQVAESSSLSQQQVVNLASSCSSLQNGNQLSCTDKTSVSSCSKEQTCLEPHACTISSTLGHIVTLPRYNPETGTSRVKTSVCGTVKQHNGSTFKIPQLKFADSIKDVQSEDFEVDDEKEMVSIKEEVTEDDDDEKRIEKNIDTISSQTVSQEDIFKAADDAAAKVANQIRDRKRGHYAYYDDETRAKIGRYAVDHGVTRTVNWFDQQFSRKVSESTVRSMRDQYIKLKNKVGAESETLPCSARGAPPKLGELDQEVQQWVSEVRRKGGVVNVRIVMAGIQGIVSKHPDYQKEIITKHYARSLLRRMGFTQKREVSQNPNIPRSRPPDFEAIKQEFLNRANTVIAENSIPDSLIINWDQISCSLIPGGDWTESDNGTPAPSKCAMLTIFLGVTKNGVLLPPQIIYAGKTNRCLPKDVLFPTNWDVTYSDSHVCSEVTMLQYIDKIILPYVQSVRHTVPGVGHDQQALVIFDGNRTNHSWLFMQKLEECKISPLYVPASCPQHIQPIGLTLCREYKDTIKDHFHLWYTQEVVLSLAKHSEDSGISSTVDLRSSSLKPRHASWIIDTHLQMQNRSEMIRESFKKAGF